jgi:hypothetical protein
VANIAFSPAPARSRSQTDRSPAGTAPDQGAADLLKAAFAEGLDRQCNGGAVRGYKNTPDEDAGTGPTNGLLIMNLGSRKNHTSYSNDGVERGVTY